MSLLAHSNKSADFHRRHWRCIWSRRWLEELTDDMSRLPWKTPQNNHQTHPTQQASTSCKKTLPVVMNGADFNRVFEIVPVQLRPRLVTTFLRALPGGTESFGNQVIQVFCFVSVQQKPNLLMILPFVVSLVAVKPWALKEFLRIRIAFAWTASTNAVAS